jgi:hypothetical protein
VGGVSSDARSGAPFKGRREGERAVYWSDITPGATAGGSWGRGNGARRLLQSMEG